MRIGVMGGGQLGRMLALEGGPLGATFRFLESKPTPSAGDFGEIVDGAYDDPEAVRRLGDGMDVVTYEFENVPVESARLIADAGIPVHPTPAALEMAQDRVAEKDGFRELGIPTAGYRSIGERDELHRGLDELGAPAVVKTRSGGYDGKGQFVLRSPADADRVWEELGGRRLILEELVEFDRELSILGVRGRDGDLRFYPLVENHHEEGVLRHSIAPAPDRSDGLQRRAERYAGRLLEELGYVGILAVELFQVGGDLLANEMAPRVHNSGHWTLDGAHHSQFENHVRAVCGYPLGATGARGPTAMFNLLGSVPDPGRILALPGVHLHDYRKSPRPMRKLGHVNVTGADPDEVRSRLDAVRRAVGG